MKPLSSYTYIKNNKRKVLPSFICTIISVFLIYLFGLLLYGSVDDFNKASVNVVKNSTFIISASADKPISDKIIEDIKSDNNVKDVFPSLGLNNRFSFQAAFGTMSVDGFVFYSEDIKKILEDLNIELIEGTIPKNNEHELLMPIELMKQHKLKIGDNINNNTNLSLNLDRTYKIVGITKGEAWIPITCDVGNIKREDCMRHGLVYCFKDPKNMKLNDRLVALKDKSISITEYKSINNEMTELVSSMNFLYAALDIIILLVLCISLGNLNYIVFLNRKNEFGVLATLGISKAKLRLKLFKENSLVCIAGYVIGIAITTLVCKLINIAVWNPNGQNVPIFRLSSLLIALIIPIVVSVISMISSIKEFNKLSYEDLK
jgi:putative ABC transport system permease protein